MDSLLELAVQVGALFADARYGRDATERLRRARESAVSDSSPADRSTPETAPAESAPPAEPDA